MWRAVFCERARIWKLAAGTACGPRGERGKFPLPDQAGVSGKEKDPIKGRMPDRLTPIWQLL